MFGRAFETALNTVEVILRIALEIRIPFDLLGENNFSVDHGGGFAITSAQVKADPAAIQMAAQFDR